MRKQIFIILATGFFMLMPASMQAWAGEFGIISETHVYPDGLRLDTDSKILVWNNMDLEDDTGDKKEGDKSLKATMPNGQEWFGMGVIWDPDGEPWEEQAKDMAAYGEGALNFWLKTETPVDVGVKSATGHITWLSLNTSDGLDIPADNQWRFISIPLSDLVPVLPDTFSDPYYYFRQIYQFFMIRDNTEPVSANLTFHVDNAYWSTQQLGELDHIVVSPATWTIPTGLSKAFIAEGFDAGNNSVAIDPAWSSSGITGTFLDDEGAVCIFNATDVSGPGSITASFGGISGSATVTAEDITWNDNFYLFIDKGMYGNLGAYDSDDDSDGDGEDDDGDHIENNSITLESVTTEHPPGLERSLKAAYDITNIGWAGVFLSEDSRLIINTDAERGDTVPAAWSTQYNDLTDETGWASDYAHSPGHSLKIVNTTAASARWSQEVDMEEPYPTKIKISGWAKADNVGADATRFWIIVQVTYDDDTVKYISADLSFSTGTHDWEYVEHISELPKPVASLKVACQLWGTTGTAWFDDISVEEMPTTARDLSAFDSGYLHFWVKTPVDLEIGLRSANIPVTYETSKMMLSEYNIDADNSWHEVYIALDDFKIQDSRMDLSQSEVLFNAAVVGERVGTLTGTFYLSDIKYVRRKEVAPLLSVNIKKRSDNEPEPSGEISWPPDTELGSGWSIADQYMELTYDNPNSSWGAQIYTDNLDENASPKYAGDPKRYLNQQPAGLIGESELLLTCPMAWMALSDVNENLPIPVEHPNEYPKGHPDYKVFFKSDEIGMWGLKEAKGEWSWLKDAGSTKWDDKDGDLQLDVDGNFGDSDYEIVSDFSATGDEYSTFAGSLGINTGWGSAEDGTRVYILNPKQPIRIYFAAKFKKARVLQVYKTNTITVELYHYE